MEGLRPSLNFPAQANSKLTVYYNGKSLLSPITSPFTLSATLKIDRSERRRPPKIPKPGEGGGLVDVYIGRKEDTSDLDFQPYRTLKFLSVGPTGENSIETGETEAFRLELTPGFYIVKLIYRGEVISDIEILGSEIQSLIQVI